MSRRLQNRKKIEVSARTAVAADRWISREPRRHAMLALSADPAVQSLLPELAAIPRIARRLPNVIGTLLESFTNHPELAPWLQTEQDFFRLCRTVGAVLHGAELARFVDGEDIAALIEDLGPEAWRFGIEHAITADPSDPTNAAADTVYSQHYFDLNRSELTDVLLAAGLRAVYGHLQDVLPDHLDSIAAALDFDWNEIDGGGDPARDGEAVRRVVTHMRTT
jgi:hypothetical protein